MSGGEEKKRKRMESSSAWEFRCSTHSEQNKEVGSCITLRSGDNRKGSALLQVDVDRVADCSILGE